VQVGLVPNCAGASEASGSELENPRRTAGQSTRPEEAAVPRQCDRDQDGARASASEGGGVKVR